MVPMFIHWLLIGIKTVSIVGRVGGLSDVVFAAEAALDACWPVCVEVGVYTIIMILSHCNTTQLEYVLT